MKLQTLEDLMVKELGSLYSAERQVINAIPKMAQAASNHEVKEALQQHMEDARMQMQRLEEVYKELGISHNGEISRGMQGIIAEGEEIIKMDADPMVRDAALIAATQRVEHYEMAGYGAARTYAQELGYTKVEKLLQKTLDEEGSSDKKLTKLAKGDLFRKGVNIKARER